MIRGQYLFGLLRKAGFLQGEWEDLASEQQEALDSISTLDNQYGRTDHQIEMELQSR